MPLRPSPTACHAFQMVLRVEYCVDTVAAQVIDEMTLRKNPFVDFRHLRCLELDNSIITDQFFHDCFDFFYWTAQCQHLRLQEANQRKHALHRQKSKCATVALPGRSLECAIGTAKRLPPCAPLRRPCLSCVWTTTSSLH